MQTTPAAPEQTFMDEESGIEFRVLSPTEQQEFQAWAQANYTPNSPINPAWHPVVRQACTTINSAPQGAAKRSRKATH